MDPDRHLADSTETQSWISHNNFHMGCGFTSTADGGGGGREPRRGAALILPEEEGRRTRVRVAEGVDALLFACVAAVHRRLHDLTKPEEAG